MHRKIQVFGERCSGTNYLESLVRANVTSAEITWEYGWKHFFPQKPITADTDTVFLVIYRHPFHWLQSLHRNPWHVAPQLRGRPFAEFIRAEWMCVYDEDSATAPADPRYGQEMLFERDPITGRRFANVMRMRTAKICAWEGIGEHTPNVLFLRYEAVDLQPEEFLHTLKERFGLALRKRAKVPVAYKGKTTWKKRLQYIWSRGTRGGFQRQPSPDISEEDEAFILYNLDLRLEHQIGYLLEYAEAPRAPATGIASDSAARGSG